MTAISEKIPCILDASLCVELNEAREELERYSGSHPKILKAYDQLVAQWCEYAKNQNQAWDIKKLILAVRYAAQKHAGQTRKDAEKTPYIIHPIGVADLLWSTGQVDKVSVLAAALLHDTLEDTDATEGEVCDFFGASVLSIVQEVTNDPSLSGEENKLRQVEHAPHMSHEAKLVKLADRLYNVRDLETPPPSWSTEKVDAYYSWGEKLLKALQGTNENLERALRDLLDQHKNQKIS